MAKINFNNSCLKDKRILITGVCGTVGSKLLEVLLAGGIEPKEVIGLDNNESGLFFLEQQFLNDSRSSLFLADIRDRDELCRKMKNVDIVFHAAALKHVILCERSPYEAVQTNVQGVNNVIFAAQENNVTNVIFTSSDKAVNPTNVMGTTKLMGERLMTAANSNSQVGSGTAFTSTRFGNVLGSNGSVVPIFRKQIAKGGPLTLTDSRMSRFVMSIDQAVNMIIDSVSMSKGGDVLITKMPVIQIKDLAEVMIEILAKEYGHNPKDIKIQEIGTKPGEKLYEELMSDEEMRRALELKDFFTILPAFRGIYRDIKYNYLGIISKDVENPYNSSQETPLTKEQLVSFLTENNLLHAQDLKEQTKDKRYWPGEED